MSFWTTLKSDKKLNVQQIGTKTAFEDLHLDKIFPPAINDYYSLDSFVPFPLHS